MSPNLLCPGQGQEWRPAWRRRSPGARAGGEGQPLALPPVYPERDTAGWVRDRNGDSTTIALRGASLSTSWTQPALAGGRSGSSLAGTTGDRQFAQARRAARPERGLEGGTQGLLVPTPHASPRMAASHPRPLPALGTRDSLRLRPVSTRQGACGACVPTSSDCPRGAGWGPWVCSLLLCHLGFPSLQRAAVWVQLFAPGLAHDCWVCSRPVGAAGAGRARQGGQRPCWLLLTAATWARHSRYAVESLGLRPPFHKMGAQFVLAAGKGWQEAGFGEEGEQRGLRRLLRAPPNMWPQQLDHSRLAVSLRAIQAWVALPEEWQGSPGEGLRELGLSQVCRVPPVPPPSLLPVPHAQALPRCQ